MVTSTAATGAGGYVCNAANNARKASVPSVVGELMRRRLELMQGDMDWIAGGKLPLPNHRGHAATAKDVTDYLNSRRSSVRG